VYTIYEIISEGMKTMDINQIVYMK